MRTGNTDSDDRHVPKTSATGFDQPLSRRAAIRLGAVASSAVGLSGCTGDLPGSESENEQPQGEWRSYGGDSRNSGHAQSGSLTAGELSEQGRVDVGRAREAGSVDGDGSGWPIWASPVVDRETVWVCHLNGAVIGYDRATGDERASVETGTNLAASPTIAENSLVVGPGNSFTALNLPDSTDAESEGESLAIDWEFETAINTREPIAYFDGTVYGIETSFAFGVADSNLFAIDFDTGREDWMLPVLDEDLGYLHAGVAVDESGVYFVTGNSGEGGARVYQYGHDGIAGWNEIIAKQDDLVPADRDHEQAPHTRALPVLDDDAVYASAHLGGTRFPRFLVCLEKEDGTQRWRHKFETGVPGMLLRPAVAGRRLYFVTDQAVGSDLEEDEKTSYLRCLATTNGTQMWSMDLEGFGPTPPTVAGDAVLVADTDAVYVLDRMSGDRLQRIELDSVVASEIVAVNDSIYFLTDDGTLHQYA